MIDALLVAGFGIQHSLLATLKAKSIVKEISGIATLGWRSIESLCNIMYVLFATAAWQKTDIVIWSVHGIWAIIVSLVFIISWIAYWYLHIYEYDCGLAFGSSTLVDKRAAQDQPHLENWTIGSRRWVRFPVHTAFFGMFLSIPHMTADLLVLGILANRYNLIGSILYDRRLSKTIPEQRNPYKDKTGLIWPPIYRNPQGATNLNWPSPHHWERPKQHFPGLLAGIILGFFYYKFIGTNPVGLIDMGRVLLAGILGSFLVGLILSIFCKPYTNSWNQNQTNLSTTDALASAIGVITWCLLAWITTNRIPNFGTFLPLWFTVQYLGHVLAYSFSKNKWHVDKIQK